MQGINYNIINGTESEVHYMSPKPMGRPKAEKPKSINLTIRLDLETNEKLQYYCDKYRISRGEAIRQGIYLLIGEDNKK